MICNEPAVCSIEELSTVIPAPFVPIVIGAIVAPVVISGLIPNVPVTAVNCKPPVDN